jgi:hypothetical protein
MDKNLNKRYGSQMIDGWFEKQVVKALTLVMLSLGQKNRLTQLATGVARTADVFTLADHTFRAGEIIQAFLPDGSVSRQGRISATTLTTFTLLLGWTALDNRNFMFR